MFFTLVDIDGDGHVSKSDLVGYLKVITAVPEGVKLDLVGTSTAFVRYNRRSYAAHINGGDLEGGWLSLDGF